MSTRRIFSCFAVLAFLVVCTHIAVAQETGTIRVSVDASQVPLGLVKTHEVLPVHAGPLTLYYPKWIPGEHGPDGPISNVTGLKFTANGKEIPWERDKLDVFTFHVDVPAGATRLDADFDYLEPLAGGFASGAASSTDKVVVISWNQNVLYFAGPRINAQTFMATLKLPVGWKHGTPLPEANHSGDEIVFKPVTLNQLVDSPVIAGEYFRVINITPPGEPIHHEMDIAADSEAALELKPETIQKMTNLVAESRALFGERHYRDYHFLLTLSDHVAHFGLEHHECNDSRLPERELIGPNADMALGGLLSHEFMHSWNGKFRRPADLATPDYEKPMQDDLLWVYEGLTDFLGPLLAARSGLWTPDQYHEYLASIAAQLGPGRPGRTWRDLQDTATGVPGLRGGPGWFNWRRGTDYYPEGDLVWLWVATIIHQQSNGQKSIDDFCHLFHGGTNNGPELKTYTFDDVVNALNQIVPYDWAKFLRERLTSLSPESPQGGIENGGWKLVFNAKEPERGLRGGNPGLAYSIGLDLGRDGRVGDSIVGSPAYKAGVTSGMTIAGVNGRVYTEDTLNDAIEAAQKNSEPIRLLVIDNDYYKTVSVDYHGGQRYPHLERVSSKPDYLDELIKPHAPSQ